MISTTESWIWLRLHHRLAATLTDKAQGKLAPKFYGLFQVLARIGPVAYRLALPPKCRIHDVFHVVFLKKFMGAPPTAVPRLPPIKHGRVLPQPGESPVRPSQPWCVGNFGAIDGPSHC
jgi:hypothetical protein